LKVVWNSHGIIVINLDVCKTRLVSHKARKKRSRQKMGEKGCEERPWRSCRRVYSSDTDNFFRPLARREANTLRPLAVSILLRNPCLFFLFLIDG
jgi:hypothetical protein